MRKFYIKFFPKQEDRWKVFKKKYKSLKTTPALLQSFFFKHLDSDNIVGEIDELREMVKGGSDASCDNLYL